MLLNGFPFSAASIALWTAIIEKSPGWAVTGMAPSTALSAMTGGRSHAAVSSPAVLDFAMIDARCRSELTGFRFIGVLSRLMTLRSQRDSHVDGPFISAVVDG